MPDTENDLKLLIAEDDGPLRKITSKNLRLSGYEIIEAADGQEAVDKAHEILPDIALLDIMMPKMDGLEVCQHLREDPKLQSVYIILLTAKELHTRTDADLPATSDL